MKGTNSQHAAAANSPYSSPAMQRRKNSQAGSQKFGSNLCAVLNDPRKDRTKIAYLFTKTWGSDFVDSAPVPSITTAHAISANKYPGVKSGEFKEHLNSYSMVCNFFLQRL
jgi:hypothetical protein